MRGRIFIVTVVLSLFAISSLSAQTDNGGDDKRMDSHLEVVKNTPNSSTSSEPEIKKEPVNRMQVVPDDGVDEKEKQQTIINPKLLGETQQRLQVVKPED